MAKAARLALVGLTIGAAALTTACGGSTSTGGSASSTDTATKVVGDLPAAKGDVDRLTWGLPLGEPGTVDPIYGLDYSPSLVSSQMCESLLRPGEGGKPQPGLAELSTPNDKTLVFTLRKGPTFWDGKPVTTSDVVYSLKRNAAPQSFISFVFANVRSISATGSREVTVRLKQPDELLAKEMVAFAGAVVEKRFSEKAGKKLGSPSSGVMCSGPFKFDSWKPGTSIELVRNDRYWDDEYRAHAKRLSFRFYDDSTALAQALQSGEIDGAYEIPPAAIPGLRDSSEGKLLVGASRQYVTMERRRTTGPLASAKLREALFRTIDRAGIAKAVYHDTAEPAYTLVTPSSWDPEARDDWASAYKPFVEAGRMDTEAGKQLVQQSGYDGTPVQFAVLSGDTTQAQLAQVFQQSAASIGVKVTIKSLSSSQYGDALLNAKVDAGDLIATTSFNVVPDPLEQIGFYVLKASPYNYTGYDDPQANAALAKAATTLDPTARAKILVGAQKRYEAAFEFASILQKNEVSFLNRRLTGAVTSLDYVLTPSLAKIGAAG